MYQASIPLRLFKDCILKANTTSTGVIVSAFKLYVSSLVVGPWTDYLASLYTHFFISLVTVLKILIWDSI
jgi:hypothetical protein